VEQHFEQDSTEPACPRCGSLNSKWSEIIRKEGTCNLCGVKIDVSYRIRLDMKSPNGKTLKRRERCAVIEHFSQFHPEVLEREAKAMGVAIKRK